MPAADHDDTDPLAAEQNYLTKARADLARMRERTLSLEVQGGDRISTEFLAATLYHRAASLVDDPTSTLFFGRIDTDGTDPSATDGRPERWYVGRRHVADESGDPVVVDWRADVSRAFYRASRAEPMGLVLRRRFGVDHGQLTAYEDEHLTDRSEQDRRSQILAGEIERPRVGPMRDIVATIQPEQDAIVRADVGTTVCVQGAPGTGKTAVGLHRAAWLLYAFRERLARSGVLVVGPNRAFLEHVGSVLPALGEIEVAHTTVEQLTATVPVKAVDPAAVAALKGDARLAEVLSRAVWSHVRTPDDALVVPRGSRRWRVPAHEVRDLVDELRSRGVRYGAARAMLPQRLAHAVLLQLEAAGDSPDDRVQDSVARSRPVKAYADALWPQLDPVRVVMALLSDAELLAACADGVLTDDEQRLLLWPTPARGPRSAPWTAADAVLVDEVADLVTRTPSLGHVVLDEAQDLSPMQLRAVGRRCSTGSMTVLGDIAQGTTPWSTRSWSESLHHLGQDGAHVEELTRGFRVPSSVIDFAAALLPHMAPGLAAPESVRDDPGTLDLVAVDDAGLVDAVVAATRTALDVEGSVGVVVADAEVPAVAQAFTTAGLEHLRLGRDDEIDRGTADHEDGAHRLHLVPATVAKGLEFDRVVVVEPAAIAEAEPDERTGLRRLYVVLTRAVTGLAVVHARPLPAALTR
ncbi:AAA family ATPase [Angustibacter peucedani]